MFTEDEIKTAKATRDEIIRDDIEVLKGIYMAGEICMWDEMREKKLSEFVPPFDKDDYEKLKKEYRQFHNKADQDRQELLWLEVIEDCEQFAFDTMHRRNRAEKLMDKFIISKK